MPERPTADAARAGGDAAFNRLSTALLLGAAIALAGVPVALGPRDAVERLAVLLRRVLPVWGR